MPPEEDIMNRGLGPARQPASATYVNRWAIVIGVSKYKHESLNLRYADRDAEEFYKLLLSPVGGNFKPDHVIKLTNQEATTANVTRALRSFLKKPGRDDLVIIYCACHGTPDFDRPENVYLLTHDADPNDIAGTALPMREIDLSLRENLLSERVVIFADTCHSAAIGGGMGRRSTGDNTTLVNRYLAEVSIARGGIALLTSAEANEVSFEDPRWGGGHGVFTHYLLRGMMGEADLNQNGFVTVGELFEYVRAKVQEATEHRQHPSIGTNPYDRNLPLAITFPSEQLQNQNQEQKQTLEPNFFLSNQSSSEVTRVTSDGRWRRITLNKTSVAILSVISGGIIVGSLFTIKHFSQTTPSTPLETTPPPLEQTDQFDEVNVLVQGLEYVRIYFGPYEIPKLEQKADYRNFARGCLAFLGSKRLKKETYFFRIYGEYIKMKGKVDPDLPDGNLDAKMLKDAMVNAYQLVNGGNNLSFESIVEPDSTQSSEEDKLSSLSSTGLVIRYYPQGDAAIVKAALAPLGQDTLKIGTSNQKPVPSTNAIWFGSQVSLQDVKLIAEKLLQAKIPIQSIRRFSDPTAKPLMIEIGADRGLLSNKPVLKLEDVRNATEFKR